MCAYATLISRSFGSPVEIFEKKGALFAAELPLTAATLRIAPLLIAA